MYYTYVLRSKKDNRLYIGWTIDLKKRLNIHNNKQNYSTRYRKPFELLYYEACWFREDAIKREKQLKTGFGRAYLKRRISNIKEPIFAGSYNGSMPRFAGLS